jgi:hypothetical protein
LSIQLKYYKPTNFKKTKEIVTMKNRINPVGLYFLLKNLENSNFPGWIIFLIVVILLICVFIFADREDDNKNQKSG